jgi:hypothetical protein
MFGCHRHKTVAVIISMPISTPKGSGSTFKVSLEHSRKMFTGHNSEFWDDRYGEPSYAYGTVANQFLTVAPIFSIDYCRLTNILFRQVYFRMEWRLSLRSKSLSIANLVITSLPIAP